MNDISKFFPVQSCKFEMKDGLVTLFTKNSKPSFIDKLLFKKQLAKDIKIDLDEIGAFIWHLCDGKINVSEITEKVKEHFGDKAEPAKNRVELFVNQMSHYKFVTLYQKKGS